ncbi:hypothetical protein CFP56_007076 [Quercus suber]|uniref:Uncharacterized protein n=1 Tax=Quercus suber TaxID=58331 RepID=A0AAW0L6V6_QUESU
MLSTIQISVVLTNLNILVLYPTKNHKETKNHLAVVFIEIRDFNIAKTEEDIGYYAGYVENNKSRAASNVIAKTTNQEENSIAGIFVAAPICEFGSVGGLHRRPPQPSSDPIYDDSPGNDRVFIRIDNNPVSVFADSSEYEEEGDSNSIFTDALEGLRRQGRPGNHCRRAIGNVQPDLTAPGVDILAAWPPTGLASDY